MHIYIYIYIHIHIHSETTASGAVEGRDVLAVGRHRGTLLRGGPAMNINISIYIYIERERDR